MHATPVVYVRDSPNAGPESLKGQQTISSFFAFSEEMITHSDGDSKVGYVNCLGYTVNVNLQGVIPFLSCLKSTELLYRFTD